MFSGIQPKPISAKKDAKNSAFKTLLFEVLSKNGDFSKIREQIKQAQIKCFVKQTYPRFLISDGTFFMSAYFTKEAFEKCHQGKAHNINITDLQDGVIVITKWTAELVQVNSAEDFTSYGGLELKMIVHDFKVKIDNEVKMYKYPANLYRDDEIKMALSSFINDQRFQHLSKVLPLDKDPFTAVPQKAPAPSARELNTLNIVTGAPSRHWADDDHFTDYTGITSKDKQTPTLTIQEIYIQEKGQEALRAKNITIQHEQRKEEPTHEKMAIKKPVAAVEEEKTNGPSKEVKPVVVKKRLQVGKDAEGKAKQIKVTTTIVKAPVKPKAVDVKKKIVVRKKKVVTPTVKISQKSKVIVKSIKKIQKIKTKSSSASKKLKKPLTIQEARKLMEQSAAKQEPRVTRAKSAQPSAPASPGKKKRV